MVSATTSTSCLLAEITRFRYRPIAWFSLGMVKAAPGTFLFTAGRYATHAHAVFELMNPDDLGASFLYLESDYVFSSSCQPIVHVAEQRATYH
jgi:hypothetical protein